FASCTLLELLLLSLVAGIGEEMLFRGILQETVSRHFGVWPGVILASTLFGLLHPISPAYVVLAGLMGVYLGGLWFASGNLLTVILAHALYDFIALVYVVRGPLSRHSSCLEDR